MHFLLCFINFNFNEVGLFSFFHYLTFSTTSKYGFQDGVGRGEHLLQKLKQGYDIEVLNCLCFLSSF